jgi:hypothetical protein
MAGFKPSISGSVAKFSTTVLLLLLLCNLIDAICNLIAFNYCLCFPPFKSQIAFVNETFNPFVSIVFLPDYDNFILGHL